MDSKALSRLLGRLLVEQHLTICTAESTTGGLIAAAITDIPGSSRYFLGAAVTYSNDAKIKLLGVPPSFIRSFGAVSAPVALAMALGASKLFGADLALATTGIAGPSGATPTKPVGLTYIAIVAPNYAACKRLRWHLRREGNRLQAALLALRLACTFLQARRPPG